MGKMSGGDGENKEGEGATAGEDPEVVQARLEQVYTYYEFVYV